MLSKLEKISSEVDKRKYLILCLVVVEVLWEDMLIESPEQVTGLKGRLNCPVTCLFLVSSYCDNSVFSLNLYRLKYVVPEFRAEFQKCTLKRILDPS